MNVLGSGLDYLYTVNEWVTICVVVVLFVGATELGYIHGRKKGEGIKEHIRSQVITMQAAMIGLFALLLGFTFSMSMIRYDARKQLILDESNAIETCFLRAKLLEPNENGEILTLLHNYLTARIAFYQAGLNERKIEEATNVTEKLQSDLWQRAVKAGREDPENEMIALFIVSLNDVFDFDAKRLAAIENHVPQEIFVLLYFAGALTMGLVGYGFGISGRRNLLVTLLSAILVSAVILMIVDLDRPRRGIVSVGQRSLVDLQKTLNKFSKST